MTFMQFIINYYKKNVTFFSIIKVNKLKIFNFNPLVVLILIVFFSILFFVTSNLINTNNENNRNNLNQVTNSNEFFNLTNYLISKINSPYKEVNYLIKNNDSIEKILKKFNIKDGDIKKISTKLKERKLSNIYSGKKLSLIYKKLEDNSNTVVNLIYPVSNTSSIEIRSFQNNYLVKENILQLYKKEIVARNIIKNNLYSSAIDVGIEPNIIVEFARVICN